MALGKLGKEMADAFGDYFLKSRKAVEESDVGATKPKPAFSYTKEMKKKGVSDEEMRDLGLIDFDTTGERAQEQFTKDEFLQEIDKRRQENVQAATQVKDTDRAFGPDARQYKDFQVDLGDPQSYREVVYSSTPSGKLAESLPEAAPGMHFKEPDQLFHLRVNDGVTEEGEPVLNLLELQSDVQQRAQKGLQLDTDPDLPMKDNWERLGVKEAVKLAVKENKRYLGIPPSDETAEAVGARQKVRKGQYVVDIDRALGEGEFALEPTGFDLSGAYDRVRELEGDSPNTVLVKPEALDDEDLLKEVGFFEDMGDYEVNRAGTYADSYVLNKLTDLGLDVDKNRQELAKVFYQEAVEKFDNFYDGLDPEEQMQIGSFDEFMRDYILSDEVADILLDAEDAVLEQGARTAVYGSEPMPKERMLKLLNIDEDEFARRLEAEDADGLRVALDEDMGVGGEGLMQFYDKKIQSKKRLKELGVPVVEITQTRPDGTLVKTQAFDLQSLMGKSPKDIPYSLYSLLAGIITTGGAVIGASENEQQPQMFAEGGMVDKQMGGLLDEGGSVDPVSGNDVPAGATQEEVRDDVPAQLSEGEFVLPADVVRYIGLDRLMKLRQEAKEGLAKMDAMGQMGNAEMATMEDTVPHDTMEVSGESGELKLAQGGFVGYNPSTQPVGSIYNPTQFQTVAPTTQQILPTPVTTPAPTTPSLPGMSTGAGYEMRTYRGPNGEVVYIPFMDGKSLMAVPTGYTQIDRDDALKPATTETPKVSTPATVSSPSPVPNGGSGDSSSNGDSGAPSTGNGAGLGSIFGKKTAEDKAVEDFLKENPDYKIGGGVEEDIKSGQFRTGLGVLGALLTGGPLAALGAAAKGFAGLRGLDEKKKEEVLKSESFQKFVEGKGGSYKLNVADAEATRRSQDMGTDAFKSWQEDKFEQRRKEAEARAKSDAEQRRKDALVEAARQEEAERKAAEAARQRAAQQAAANASRAYGGDSDYNYASQASRQSSKLDAGTGSGISAGGGNASRGFTTGGWAKGGLISKRKKK